MIVNETETSTPLMGKQWKSVHSVVKSFPKVKVKGGNCLVETSLQNFSNDGNGWTPHDKAPSHYEFTLYEMGQIMGGN